MKTVTVPKRAKSVNALLKAARKTNLILRAPDGTEYILAEIDDFDREIELTRRNKRLMKYLERRARQTKTVPLAQLRSELGLG